MAGDLSVSSPNDSNAVLAPRCYASVVRRDGVKSSVLAIRGASYLVKYDRVVINVCGAARSNGLVGSVLNMARLHPR